MLFTEFAENGSVFDYIFKECKQPSPSQILLWATQVAEGTVMLNFISIGYMYLWIINLNEACPDQFSDALFFAQWMNIPAEFFV